MIQELQFLFDMYSPDRWGWEIIETIRRLMMTGTLVLLPAGSVSQLSMAIFVSLAALASYINFKPFIKIEENVVAVVTMLNIFITVFMGLLLKLAGDESFSGGDSRFIGWMMTVLTIAVLVLAIVGTFLKILYSSGSTRRRLTFIRTRLKAKKREIPSKHKKVTRIQKIKYELGFKIYQKGPKKAKKDIWSWFHKKKPHGKEGTVSPQPLSPQRCLASSFTEPTGRCVCSDS